jgi:hypothetical protein
MPRTNKPKGLGPQGSTLWASIIGDLGPGLELDAKELAALENAARMEDAIAELEAVVREEGPMSFGVGKQRVVHPALVEMRHLRLAIHRLLSSIGLTADESARGAARSAAGRKAAQARWANRTAADG